MNENLNKLKEDILDLFWRAPDFDAAIHEALNVIGTKFTADCVFLTEFSNDGLTFEDIYLWKPAGEKPVEIKSVELICQYAFDMMKGLAAYEQTVYWCVDNVRENMRVVLEKCGISSVLLCPIIKQGELYAYLGVADSAASRNDWKLEEDIRSAMNTLSKTIGIFLLRMRNANRSEQMQQNLEDSLETTRQRADNAYELLDGISAGVIIVDIYPDGSARPQYGNLGLYRMLRLSRTAENAVVPDRSVAALEGEYFDDFFANIPEPDYSRVRREYLDGFSKDSFSVKKYRLLRGDGSYVWVSADLTLRNATPGYRTYYVTYADVSEEQDLQFGLMKMLDKEKEMTAKLEKASRAKSDFLSRMSHDIRTPMNAIMGMTAIAGSHIDDPSKVRDCLEKIAVSSKLLLSIINEVLDMSKVESGRFVLAEEVVDLTELVQSVVTMFQTEIDSKHLNFTVRVNDVVHEKIISDMQRLQQLLVNLLSNAVKYTSDNGEVSLELYEISSDREDYACFQFIVTDSGVGISPKFLERIFEPFERAEDVSINSVQGTGLGLAICKTVVEMMGGRIQVESELGKGSRFTATLYFRIKEETKADQLREEELPHSFADTEVEHSYTGQRLLLVEDNELNREIAVELLSATGAEVDTAENGKIAVDKVMSSPEGYYQLIFMDMQMPVMDGCSATRAIRALDREDVKTIPIVAMTANAFADDRKKTREAGMDEHMAKPIDMNQLYEVLHKYLALK